MLDSEQRNVRKSDFGVHAILIYQKSMAIFFLFRKFSINYNVPVSRKISRIIQEKIFSENINFLGIIHMSGDTFYF